MPCVNKVVEPHHKQMKLTTFFLRKKSCKSVGFDPI